MTSIQLIKSNWDKNLTANEFFLTISSTYNPHLEQKYKSP